MQKGEETRDRLLTIRCSNKELRRFKRIAAHHDMGVATVIRLLAKREALRIKGEKQ